MTAPEDGAPEDGAPVEDDCVADERATASGYPARPALVVQGAWRSSMFLAVVLSLALPLDARAQGKPTAATAWYDPEQVAAQSALFKTASDQTGPRFLAIEGQLRRISPALEDLELASALAADALGPKTKTWAQGRRRLALQQRALAQSQVDELQDAYIAAFDAALQRALRARKDGAGAVECSAGTGMQAMMRRQPACPGTDLSAELARQMDQDPLLQASPPCPGRRSSCLPSPRRSCR